MEVPSFHETSPALKNVWLSACNMYAHRIVDRITKTKTRIQIISNNMMKSNCFCGMVDRHTLSPARTNVLTIWNLWDAASRMWICIEPKFRVCWMKLCSSDNHYITAPIGKIYPEFRKALLKKSIKGVIYDKKD